jgi:hypothetical protein
VLTPSPAWRRTSRISVRPPTSARRRTSPVRRSWRPPYSRAASLKLSGDVKKFVTQFGTDEAAHVAALTGTITNLGGKPTARPTFSFPISDEKSFLKLAQTLEDTGVSAYNGAGPMIKSKEVLGAAGSIVQIEARHAAVIRLLNGAEPAPSAFDPTKSVKQVTAAVAPLIT